MCVCTPMHYSCELGVPVDAMRWCGKGLRLALCLVGASQSTHLLGCECYAMCTWVIARLQQHPQFARTRDKPSQCKPNNVGTWSERIRCWPWDLLLSTPRSHTPQPLHEPHTCMSHIPYTQVKHTFV